MPPIISPNANSARSESNHPEDELKHTKQQLIDEVYNSISWPAYRSAAPPLPPTVSRPSWSKSIILVNSPAKDDGATTDISTRNDSEAANSQSNSLTCLCTWRHQIVTQLHGHLENLMQPTYAAPAILTRCPELLLIGDTNDPDSTDAVARDPKPVILW
jgi:hypothetical protein